MNPVIAMLIGVVVMMVLIICTRMHAFPSLIISAILIAVLSGNYLLAGTGNEGGNLLSVAINTVTGGFGGTMTSIGIVIGFGCIMGIFLEKSGAAKRMAITILKLVGVKRADVVLGLTGFVVSIPVFCDSGFVILSSLAKEFSRLTKKSMVGLGGILGIFDGSKGFSLLWPYALMQAGMNANKSEDALAGSYGMFFLSCAFWLAAMFLLAWGLLRKRDVKA